jgi:hypothetical protein
MSKHYETENLFVAPMAAEEARMRGVHVVAADRVGMTAIYRDVVSRFPAARQAQRLGELVIPSTACILRLADNDPRFATAADDVMYSYAKHIASPNADRMHMAHKSTIGRVYRGDVIEVTVPALLDDNARYGEAWARGLLEFAGVIAPSDDITGEIDRQHPIEVLSVLDAAQHIHPDLFVIINGTTH